MRTITIRQQIVLSLGLVAALSMAACSATKPPNSAGPPAGHTVVPAASPAPTQAASPPAGAPSATPAPPGGVQNLIASNSVRTELISVFAAYKQIPLSEMTGIHKGSLYYAYDPSTDTYWAMADFDVSASAPQTVQVDLQDGGSTGMFKTTGGGAWQMQLGAVPPVCGYGKFFPSAVLAVWALPAHVAGVPYC